MLSDITNNEYITQEDYEIDDEIQTFWNSSEFGKDLVMWLFEYENNYVRYILSLNPPFSSGSQYISNGNISVGDEEVCLGSFSFRLFGEKLEANTFDLMPALISPTTGIKITINGTDSYQDKKVFKISPLNQSDNNNLSDIKIDGISLKGFDKDTLKYDIYAEYNKTDLTLKPILEDNTSKMEIEKYIFDEENVETLVGNLVINEQTGEAFTILDSQGKKTVYKIIVTAEDGNKKTYTLTFDRDEIVDLVVVPPTKLSYMYNEDLVLTNGTVKEVLKSGKETQAIALEENMVLGYNKLIAGTYNLDVEYLGFTKENSFTVTVEDVVDSITLNNAPTNVEWGEDIDLEGFTLTRHFKGGTEDEIIPVTKEKLSGYTKGAAQSTKTETKEITVTDSEKTAKFNISVDNLVVDMELSKNEIDVNWGEELDLSELKYKEILKSGAQIENNQVTAGMVTGYDKEKETTGVNTVQTATVTHPDVETITKPLTVNVLDAIDKIEVSKNPNKMQYNYQEEIELAGGELTVTRLSGGKTVLDLEDENIQIKSGETATTIGTHTVTLEYEDKTCTFDVEVEDVLGSISLDNPPEEVEWDEEIDLNNFGIILHFLGGSIDKLVEAKQEYLLGYTKGEEISGEYEIKTIKVTYKDKEAFFNIKVVNPVVSIEMKTLPKTEYTLNEELDITTDGEHPAEITVTRKNGETFDVELSESMVSEFDTSQGVDELPVTVTYLDKTTTYNIKVKSFGYITGSITTANWEGQHSATVKAYIADEVDWEDIIRI